MDVLLFSPCQIRRIMLRNRIVLSLMLQCSAVGGCVNDWRLMHYGRFAAGGAGRVPEVVRDSFDALNRIAA